MSEEELPIYIRKIVKNKFLPKKILATSGVILHMSKGLANNHWKVRASITKDSITLRFLDELGGHSDDRNDVH